MAPPHGSSKATQPCHRRRENLTSLLTEVLRPRLQALNLPITGRKAKLISRLKEAVEQPCPIKQPPPSQVKKSRSKKPSRSDCDPVTAWADTVDNMSNNSSSIGSVDGLDEDDVDLSQFRLSVPQSVTPVHSPKPKWLTYRTLFVCMGFRCGQNYTDGKNMLKTIRKSKLVKYSECNKKQSRFAKYMFTNEKIPSNCHDYKQDSNFLNLS